MIHRSLVVGVDEVVEVQNCCQGLQLVVHDWEVEEPLSKGFSLSGVSGSMMVISPRSASPADSRMSSGVMFLIAHGRERRQLWSIWEVRLRPEAGVGACWEVQRYWF